MGSESATANGVSLGDWPPLLSQFRMACEECHKRKVRCDPPLDATGTSCQACQANNRSCLFSLRSKTGRPCKLNGAISDGAGTAASHSMLALSLIGHRRSQTASFSTSAPGYLDAADPHVLEGHQQPTPEFNPALDASPSMLTPLLGDPQHQQGQPWLPQSSSWAPMTTLLLDSPPLTAPVFQDLDTAGEDIFMDNMLEADVPYPSPNDQYHPGRPATTGRYAQLPPRAPDACTPGSESLPLPDPFVASGGDGDRIAGPADPVGDFSDAMRLCGLIHQRCQARRLSFLCEADHEALSLMIQTIEELSRKTLAVNGRLAGAQRPPATQLDRQDYYKWMILRVAVAEAVDMAADLVEFNLGGQAIATGGEQHQHHQQQQQQRQQRQQHQYQQQRRPAGPSRRSTDPTAFGKPQRGWSNAGGMRGKHLESLMQLVRLDYSLLGFRASIAAHECSHRGHDDPALAGVSAGGTEEGSKHACPCIGSTVSSARIAQIRDQIWMLAERLRTM